MSGKHDRASELRAIADGRLLLNVRNGVTVSRSMLAMIADELDAERAAHAETKRELDEALKALEPFARHLDEMKFDFDNRGNPLPDDQAVGWVYVTNGDFRAARRVREGGKADG